MLASRGTGRKLPKTPAIAAGLLLLAQTGWLQSLATREERVPPMAPLKTLPATFNDWFAVRDVEIQSEVQAVLKADDTLTRHFERRGDRAAAALSIAFFRTQRTGVAPHSPKNCMPGSGWLPVRVDVQRIEIPGRRDPIEVNRYVVQRGDEKSVVLYWYQSHGRVVASEYRAKFFLVLDALRYNRTDTALVRVTVPVDSRREDAATQQGVHLIQSVFAALTEKLPG